MKARIRIGLESRSRSTPELCLVLKMQIIQHLDLDLESSSRSRSFETLNILKEENFYQRCGSECATFTKDIRH